MGQCMAAFAPEALPTPRSRTVGPVLTRAQLIASSRGKVFDFYRRAGSSDQLLGEGSFGVVCRAAHRATGARRAVKRISAVDAQACKHEIALLKSLDHPNIVRLYETVQDARHAYLVMELCEGGELFDRIVSGAEHCLPESDARAVTQGMLRAVRYMHGKEIVHRDLKPENFLFGTKGPIADNMLKLIDFGTARHCKETQLMTSMVGTFLYIAPQVLMRRYGRECDLWSFGAVLYVMLSGRPPFLGATDAAVQLNVRLARYSFTGRPWDRVSQEAKHLVAGLLQRDPRLRFTADQALGHVWLAQLEELDTPSLGEDMINTLGTYSTLSNMKRSALQALALQLDDEQLKLVREQFVALDKNSDGVLTEEELAAGLQRAGICRSGQEVSSLVRSIDTDGNAVLDYTEFLAAALDRDVCFDEEACRLAFSVFDRNGDGRISLCELSAILGNNSKAGCLPKRAVQEWLLAADGNWDGEISFEEFMEMMSTGQSEASTAASAMESEASAADA